MGIRTRTPTRVERLTHDKRIRHHTPGLSNGNPNVVLKTNGATPAVRLERAVLFDKPTHSWPLPVLARVGPLNDDDPPETDGALGNDHTVLPQLTADNLIFAGLHGQVS